MDEEEILTKGLQEGYAGGTQVKKVKRGSFTLKSSHLEEDGKEYHDEWAADRVGGGQELIKVGGKKYTRVYAGGTILEEELKKLGIEKKDVTGKLKEFITEYGNKNRLYKDFSPEPEGDWRYKYKIIDKEDNIPVTTGKESIFYKDTLVFVHLLTLCPVE